MSCSGVPSDSVTLQVACLAQPEQRQESINKADGNLSDMDRFEPRTHAPRRPATVLYLVLCQNLDVYHHSDRPKHVLI